MKTLKLILALVIVIGLAGCDKRTDNELSNLTVERYVALLKANQYDSLNLPAFTYKDIPALLAYRNETQLIQNFPQNGISSLLGPDCTLGMYVLWTIESIRAVAINSNLLILRFPSQNPILALRDATEMTLVYDNTSHETVAKAYNDWWENNKQKAFNDFKNIDPLTGTSYKWH
jgi:hypothetical protein